MGMNGNGHALKATGKRYRIREPKPRRFVDYHTNAKDFLCVMLAACGWTSQAIANHLGMSKGCVDYRIGKAERERRADELTQRSKYRNGQGSIAHAIVATITSRGSIVKKEITTTLDKRGLYAPQPTGVIRHDAAKIGKNGQRKVRQ